MEEHIVSQNNFFFVPQPVSIGNPSPGADIDIFSNLPKDGFWKQDLMLVLERAGLALFFFFEKIHYFLYRVEKLRKKAVSFFHFVEANVLRKMLEGAFGVGSASHPSHAMLKLA